MDEIDLDAFWITSSEGVDMCCPTGECWDYISVGNGDTLAEIRRKAGQHVAEKHPTVINGEVTTERPALSAQ
jgi:hypothetical protein